MKNKKIKTNFAQHTLECNICKKEGTIVNPDPKDYCKKGYQLLMKMIEETQDLMKAFLGV